MNNFYNFKKRNCFISLSISIALRIKQQHIRRNESSKLISCDAEIQWFLQHALVVSFMISLFWVCFFATICFVWDSNTRLSHRLNNRQFYTQDLFTYVIDILVGV